MDSSAYIQEADSSSSNSGTSSVHSKLSIIPCGKIKEEEITQQHTWNYERQHSSITHLNKFIFSKSQAFSIIEQDEE